MLEGNICRTADFLGPEIVKLDLFFFFYQKLITTQDGHTKYAIKNNPPLQHFRPQNQQGAGLWKL